MALRTITTTMRHLGFSVIGFLLVGCSSGDGASVSDDNVVNVYNWADYIAEDTIDKFEAEYGIKVNYDFYDSAEIVDVKLLAGNSGYDVIIHSNSYSARILPVGVYDKLDYSRLTNLHHLDDDVMNLIDRFGPVREYQVPYHWGSTGYAWNARLVRERLPDHPMDSADVLFDPEVVSKLADCGVALLDGPVDLIPMVLAYLGRDPNAVDDESLQAVEEQLRKVRPYIRYFSNSKMLVDMPSEETCVAMSWSGDYATAKYRAEEAGLDIDLRYTTPKEGSGLWVDGLYIPKDARHKDNAYLFIDFLMRPDIAADIANTVNYANANRSSWDLINPEQLRDEAIYPSEATREIMYANLPQPPKRERVRTRVFARAKAGL
ncbi:MAG: extracellular solute-binding protein [Pseudomonadota bacterium]